ncbi:MAG: RagB/SusD family nutrient uptake outer membrane protein [Bacteroides sp.]
MSNIIKTLGIVLFCLSIASCSELSFGNKFLGKEPDSSGATTEQMFSSKSESDKVLTKAYTGLPYGLPTSWANPRLGNNLLESISDLCYSFRDNINDGPLKLYYNGALSANNVNRNAAYLYGGETDWTTIRYAWLYIENVDKVPDISDKEKNERIAEAKTLIALSYYNMMRYIGGVPWLDHAIDVNEPMKFPRITFAETITKIVQLLDEAIPNLVWKQDPIDDGRMSKAGAMALKFKTLLWAASPTFNSDTKWHSEADEYTCYGDYKLERWSKAEAAGKELLREIESKGGYALKQATEDTHRARRLAYRSAYYDRGGSEIIISTRHGYDVSIHSQHIDQRYYVGPTLNYVDLFDWEDGSEFPQNFDWQSPAKDPFFTYSESEGMIPTRDPRLYENIACPGDMYVNGTTAPVYINHPKYNKGSGFMIMKFILQEDNDRANRPVQWPYIRLAEIYLDYAEVLNELKGNPTTEAYNYVNKVRERVGLKNLPTNLNKSQFREALLKERACELGFEEVRWFDLVRHHRETDFVKPLYGLRSRGNDLNHPTAFTFEKVSLDQRFWADTWDSKWYLSPIPQDEINKHYGMTQNPGW